MEIGETLYVKGRKAWRAWLAKHRATKREIWLVYPNKASGKERIPYNDAVEEALCYGWIDSTLKKHGGSHAQRFTPRKSGSGVSWMNKERIWKLISEGKMTQHGLDAVSKAFNPLKEKAEDFAFPKDIIAAIRKDNAAWQNFQKMPDRYKRVRVAYIDGVRGVRPGDFEKRLRHFVKKTAQDKRFGMMTD